MHFQMINTNQLLILGALFSVGSSLPLETDRGIIGINGIVDGLLKIAKDILTRDGYDPLNLPPYEISILHLGMVGKLKLQNCELYNLATLYRSSGILTDRVNNTVNAKVKLGFDPLKINCDYKISLLTILQKKGTAVVTIPKLSAETDIDITLPTFKVQLNNLELHNNGKIDVHLEGGILDGLLSILTEAISNLFKSVIINQIEKALEDEIRNILGQSATVPYIVG